MNITEASCKTNKINTAIRDYTKHFGYSCVNTIISASSITVNFLPSFYVQKTAVLAYNDITEERSTGCANEQNRNDWTRESDEPSKAHITIARRGQLTESCERGCTGGHRSAGL